MNFSHNTESVLQHVDHLRPIEFFFEKMMGKINYFPRGWGGGGSLWGKFHEKD